MLNWKKNKSDIKQWIVKKAEEPFLSVLTKELKRCDSVLDVGCGIYSSLGQIPKTFYSEGIDMLPSPKKALRIHDKYKRGNILNLREYYKKKSFDGVIAVDVIEHLKKSDGLKLLRDLEWIARKKIIILTPDGFHYQGEVDNNPYMRHLSGWKSKEFKKYGYRCYGMHGLKLLRGEQAGIRFKPWYLWLFLSHLSQYITRFFPSIAFHILAVKTVRR